MEVGLYLIIPLNPNELLSIIRPSQSLMASIKCVLSLCLFVLPFLCYIVCLSLKINDEKAGFGHALPKYEEAQG